MRRLAIANPAAGRAHEAERVIARLRARTNVHAEIVQTTAAGDATRIANGASSFDGLVAIGGGGTMAKYGRVRTSRANGSRCFRWATVTAWRDLGVGIRNERWRHSQRGLCRRSNVAMPERFEALVGSAKPVRRTYTGLVVINNTPHLGNFRGFPDASIRDGMLDIMEQDYRWPRQLLHNLAVLAGSRALGPRYLCQATTCERLELGQARTYMADGELLHGVSSVAVRCRPSAALCIVGNA